jgi:thioesterase domain-containing protein
MPDTYKETNSELTSKELLQRYLQEQIPISSAMGIQIEEASCEKIVLSAPLQANINHKKTVFGGSLHAATTLACWSLIFLNLKDFEKPTEIVIVSSEIKYLLPVTADFKAECALPEQTEWHRFQHILRKKGKARIPLTAHIAQDNQLAVKFQGIFAAIIR